MNVFECIAEQARLQPDHVAVIEDGGRRVSYAELVERARQRAAEITAAGIQPDWRVGMIVPQSIEFIETALAILAAGACMVPIAEDHPASTIADIVRRAHLHALIQKEEPSVRILTNGDASDSAGRASDETRSPTGLDPAAEREFAATGPAYLRFTSGTTSERKGVVIGHARILERLEAANRRLAIGPEDRVLWLLPMAHHFVVSILLYLRYGATILLPSSSLAPSVLKLAQEEHATVLYASPHHMKLLAKDTSTQSLSSLRLTISTAEGLRAEIAEAFAARYGIAIVQALGIMEVGLAVMNTTSCATKPDVLGRAQPPYQVWLRGEDGKPAEGTSAETSGEICIRGPGLLDAYLDPWTPAARIVEPDGFRTGDQGWFDADGDLHLAGRRAARINMAGMKFFCEEVEAVLDTHPAVERSRVSAKQHPHLGELPVAEIVLASGAELPNAKDLAAFCRRRLASYMVPRTFDVVKELPMTPTGKLARR